MKLFAGLGALLFALAISCVAATFSVTGLAALFAAAYWPVIVMGSTLEGAKLVAAAWLHSNWHNKRVGVLHKLYLTLAVIALMLITAIGIYGYLSKGYLDQQAPVGAITIEIEQHEADIRAKQDDLQQLRARGAQLDAAVNGLIGQQHVVASQRLRASQQGERADIARGVSADEAAIESVSAELVPLKLKTSDVSAKLGPVRYVADLFGWKDTDTAVRMIILTLMFAFDPLAVVLILSAAISIGEWQQERRDGRSRGGSVAVDLPEPSDPEPSLPPAEPAKPMPPLPLAARRPKARPVAHRGKVALGVTAGDAPPAPEAFYRSAGSEAVTGAREAPQTPEVVEQVQPPASEASQDAAKPVTGSFQRFGSKGWLDE